MSNTQIAKNPKNYKVGIDVGTHSVGLTAIEVDSDGSPISLLSSISHIHDSGVLEAKTATSRLAASGVARRTRRLVRRRRKRLFKLENKFHEWGWEEKEASSDPHEMWRARTRLATEYITDEAERNHLLIIALRHIARHRGWRNPYISASKFYVVTPSSEQFLAFKGRVEETTEEIFADNATVAEIALAAIEYDFRIPLRPLGGREFSFLGGKLMQSDNANEIHAYARTQRLDDSLLREMIDIVFLSESPRGSWVSKIGKDPLDSSQVRAAKATDAFQRYRIASTLANVRVNDEGIIRPFSVDERQQAFKYLVEAKHTDTPSWSEVAEHLGLKRRALSGTASLDDEGAERMPLKPPVHVTNNAIADAKKLKSLKEWWKEQDSNIQDAFVHLIVDGKHDEESEEGALSWEFLNSLDEEALAALETLNLPAGRAAYSIPTLRKLTRRILTTEDDLHTARMAEFGIPADWVPPSEPINAPVGNPAVDRVTKIVGRWLMAAEREWGAPSSINLEHVRNAFMSESAVRDKDREMRKRAEANEKTRLEIKSGVKDGERIRNSDVHRYEAIQRQNCQCLYCGDQISFETAEMDHIVPRKGTGSTNKRTNLAAVCRSCNSLKSSTPFAAWAKKHSNLSITVDAAIERTHHWIKDKGTTTRTWNSFLKEVRERISRTDLDPELDSRSLESVAWMANELRDRIDTHFKNSNTKVRVFRGATTAGAREAAGIAEMIPFIGGGKKTRLDRRHHAVDAAVVALLDESIGRTLQERNDLRTSYFINPRNVQDFRTYYGSSETAISRFEIWKSHMNALAQLLIDGFNSDEIVVMENMRLRLGNGKAHDDKIHPLITKRVGDELSIDEIDAASTPALWMALTNASDFDSNTGLPENPNRVIRLHDKRLKASDTITFFDKPRAAIAVRDGWAQLGDSIHHTRVYRWEEKGKTKFGMLRVFSADLQRYLKKDKGTGKRVDLFNVPPHPSWISMRTAHKSIGKDGVEDKEYIGWLVSGDELRFNDVERVSNVDFNRELTKLAGEVHAWRVTGFGERNFDLKPKYIAKEGLDKIKLDDTKNDIDLTKLTPLTGNNGWRAAPNTITKNLGGAKVIRRDALGRIRTKSNAHLPITWDLS